MIGSFWNLCRACPSMPVDKLHSEYRSTYRWHEYTGGSRPEVIRRPPIPNQFGTSNEPPLPRRKKCPELAYKTHEFISCDEPSAGHDRTDHAAGISTRARSEERGGTPSRRSKSEGPPGVGNRRFVAPTIPNGPIDNSYAEDNVKIIGQAGESSGLFKKTITKLSTEYRLQFVWPHVRRAIKGDAGDVIEPPRKSISLGAIKSTQSNTTATIHKKRTTNQKEAAVHELEPLVNDVDEKRRDHRPMIEKKQTNARFSSQHTSNKEKYGFTAEAKQPQQNHQQPQHINHIDTQSINDNKMTNSYGAHGDTWYKDVIELRKKAGEYKCRGWGTEIDPELYKKQKDLWEQVSRRSSLSALSLASTVQRPITKEEKEKENNKKSSPTKAVSARARIPGQAQPVDNKMMIDGIGKTRRDTVRHHLERTTGPDVEEGALLPSPTREKLMPTIPKSKDEDNQSPQRSSPKKSIVSRHGSPQKGSPQKSSPKKMSKARSQSVGPTETGGSPKRQIRTGNIGTSTTAAATNNTTTTGTTATATPAAKPHKNKTPISTPTVGERRPRPTTLSTTVRSRTKSSSLPPSSGRAHSVPISNHLNQNNSQTIDNNSSSNNLNVPNLRKTNKLTTKQQRPKSTIYNEPLNDLTTTIAKNKNEPKVVTNLELDKKTAETEEDEKDGVESVASASPLPVQEITEHIVKSPPEPTRVKSPEQILMRSPDPVNWTVPLDTGKTFTVTQNVRDGGEPVIRPQSEFKASTPVDKPPPAPQSAPPELAEQGKMDAWKSEQHDTKRDLDDDNNSSNTSVITGPIAETSSTTTDDVKTQVSTGIESEADTGVSSVAGAGDTDAGVVPEIRYDKPVPGSTLRCLDDPIFDPDVNSPSGSRTNTSTSDVLEKARNRFDRFWGGNNSKDEENV